MARLVNCSKTLVKPCGIDSAVLLKWISRVMKTAKRPTLKTLQSQCDKFNASVSVGDSVTVKLDGVDEPFLTKTRGVAQVLSGHSAVIWLENVSGCYLLDRVKKHEDSRRTAEVCDRCDGDGKAHGSDRPFEYSGPDSYPGKCPVCKGSGTV